MKRRIDGVSAACVLAPVHAGYDAPMKGLELPDVVTYGEQRVLQRAVDILVAAEDIALARFMVKEGVLVAHELVERVGVVYEPMSNAQAHREPPARGLSD